MRKLKALAKRLWTDESGLELSEYAILIGLIVVLIIATITTIGQHILTIFGKLAEALGTAAAGG